MDIAKFTFSLFGVNTYVLTDRPTGRCAIIDPGMMDAGEEEAIAGYIGRNHLMVTHIINTHLHLDHAVGNKYASEIFKAPILAHKADLPLGERMQQQAAMFGIQQRINEFSVTSYLNDGDIIKIGDSELKAIHVPGHSPGGIALYCEKDHFLISGDSLFAGSVGRADLPGGDMLTLLNAINDKLLTLPDDTVVYPGHGPATTIGAEKRSNPFLKC